MAITQVSNSLVKQDLTISGGTVDNTVIGSGTPAAGTFTTVAGTLASTVTGTTAAASDNSTKIATTAYVTTALANLVDSAPGTLNTLNELAAALGDDASFSTTVTNSIATKLPLAGGTMTGDVVVNDSVKFKFGTGSDLQIFHDGNNSFINNTSGTAGALSIKSHDINLMTSSSETMASFVEDGAVTLYYDNSAKLATTSAGIDVTGGLDVEIADNAASPVAIQQGGNSYFKIVTTNSSESVQLGNTTTNPDILLGGGNVGIGNTSPNAELHIGTGTNTDVAVGSQTNPALQIGGTNNYRLALYTDAETGYIENKNGDDGISFRVKTAGEAMVIDAIGNVGINNASPAHRLHIQGATNDQARVRVSNTSTGQASLDLENTEGYFRTFTDAGEYRIYDQTDGAYRLIIDTSGKVGIGTSTNNKIFNIADPAQGGETLKLHFEANSSSDLWEIYGYDRTNSHYTNISLGAQALYIQGANSRVGIGETQPLGHLHIKDGDSGMGSVNANFDKLVLEDSSHSGMTILGGANTHGAIYFGDPDVNDVGQIKYKHNDNSLCLTTNSVERFKIDSGGQIRFGKSINFMDSTLSSSKFWLAKSRDILGGTDDHAVYYTESGQHHQFWLGGVRRVNIINDGITFGTSTGTADTLNDFEEGTWVPSFYAGGLTVTQINFARFTKVKNFVQCICYVSIGGTPNGANLTLAGLPFSVTTNAFGVGVSDMEYQPVGTYIRAQSGTSQAIFLKPEGSSTGRSVLGGTNFNAGYGIFNFSYYTS